MKQLCLIIASEARANYIRTRQASQPVPVVDGAILRRYAINKRRYRKAISLATAA